MTTKVILLWSGAAILLIAALLGGALALFLRPSRGERIPSSSAGTALIVIDIQEDYTGPQARKRYRDGERIVAASNALIAEARRRGIPVAFVRNEIANPLLALLFGHLNAPGTPGAEMDRRLERDPGTPTFVKHRPDSFTNPALDAWLREHQVEHLIITGLDAAYCVNATMHGALNRGYRVSLYRDAIATESGRSLDELAGAWRKAGASVETGTRL